MILLWSLQAAADIPPRRACTIERRCDATEEGQSCTETAEDSTACSALIEQGYARRCAGSDQGGSRTVILCRTKTEHTQPPPPSPEAPITPAPEDAPGSVTPPDEGRCAVVTGGGGVAALLAMALGFLRRRSDDV